MNEMYKSKMSHLTPLRKGRLRLSVGLVRVDEGGKVEWTKEGGVYVGGGWQIYMK